MNVPKRILVVDDERDFCKLMVMMLEREPYLVDCAFNLREAALSLTRNHHEIVLLDNNLPDGTGLHFAIKSKEAFAKCHVILITADASPSVIEEAVRAGIDFLPKPFGLKKLREMIKTTT